MTYEESAALMVDMVFRGRIKVAVLRYADAIQLEPIDTPAHSSRYRWAQNAYQQPDAAAAQVHPPVVMDPAVQSDGPGINDAALQGAVEVVIRRFI